MYVYCIKTKRDERSFFEHTGKIYRLLCNSWWSCGKCCKTIELYKFEEFVFKNVSHNKSLRLYVYLRSNAENKLNLFLKNHLLACTFNLEKMFSQIQNLKMYWTNREHILQNQNLYEFICTIFSLGYIKYIWFRNGKLLFWTV